ncbi:MAG: DegT/DnrJ/EryC1/StrS family aminotransferase [Candidatus Aminicenantia bacterium]
MKQLIEVVKSGRWGCFHGEKVKEFEKQFSQYHKSKFGIAVSSGSTGLIVALKALGLKPDEEVIIPAYTFIATAFSVIEAGGKPKFVDIDPETYNISPKSIKESISPNTKGIIPVHLAGQSANMTAILEIASKYNLFVLEDAAQAWGAEWNGKKVGTIGQAGIFSFQLSKNITSGEGGIILTNDQELAKKARSFSNCGRMEDGVWYEHYLVGGNYRLTEFQGAVLLAQLARYETLKQKREKNARYLTQRISEIEGISPLKREKEITSHANHLYIFRYDKNYFNQISKKRIIEVLNAEGIPAYSGYSLPLYKQPVFREEYNYLSLPAVEKACYEEAIWLNQRVLLGEEKDLDDIIDAFLKIRENLSHLT